jgi:hypothetical protein
MAESQAKPMDGLIEDRSGSIAGEGRPRRRLSHSRNTPEPDVTALLTGAAAVRNRQTHCARCRSLYF